MNPKLLSAGQEDAGRETRGRRGPCRADKKIRVRGPHRRRRTCAPTHLYRVMSTIALPVFTVLYDTIMARGTRVRISTALLVVTLLATLVSADKCRSGCGGVTPSTFKYQPGTTYKYNLEGNIDIALSSADGQQTSTKLRGVVLLTQLPECNQVIRLQNVHVVGPDSKKHHNLENIDKAIRINFHDGHVEDEICAEAGDTQNSLNIKRAVASMFQAAVKHSHEHDVFGDCPTEISTRKEGGNLVIHKSRNLNRCGHRESMKQDFMATSFNLKSEIKSTPLLNADYESEQRVKNGILEHALVTENYLYKPFSDGKNGAKATVSTKITFAGESKETVQPKTTTPKSIYFENPHIDTLKTANVDNILNAMKETKKTMDVSVTENSAKTFVQLIKVLRASRKDDILAVFGQIRSGAGFADKVGARKVFFDALFRTGTGESTEAIIHLYRNKQLDAVEEKIMFLSLAFVRHATPASLTAAAGLLETPNIPREAYLGVGILAGKYCKEHRCDINEMNHLMQKLSGKLNPQPANRQEENVVIAILKGLGNVHHLDDVIVDKLVAIASSKKSPTRLRVAALEVFVSDACKPKLRDAALRILKDRQEDTEVRIKAYLAVAQCPDSKSAHAIREMLNTEPYYQVGSFIVTHLRNLRSSANPDRELAKQHLGVIRTTKKFPFDIRKYSFNNEFSYSVDTAGVGSAFESNVIYSQDSFLPRSTNLNLTTEMFGHTFNFLEIGTRQENLDRVVEHYFGPLGLFATQSPEEMFDSGKESLTKLFQHVRERYEKTTRGKRDVTKADIDALSKQIKMHEHALDKDLDLDLSVKVLGSEILFLSLNEDIQKLTPEAIVDKLFDGLDSGIETAKNFEYHLKNHLLFLDMELSYPTSLGFPLRLSLEGSSAVHFITHGSVDVRQLIRDPKNAHFKVSVIPSANIEMSAMMSIDTHLVETGLKVTSNVLTSTGIDVDFTLLKNGKGVDVKVGVPVEKQKIMSLNHEIVFSNHVLGSSEVTTPLKFKEKTKEFEMCFDQLSPFIGLAFCGSLNTPPTIATNHVTYPLNGPSHLHLSIDREDLKEYHFKALLNDQKPEHQSLEITFETPGSKSNRFVKLLLEAALKPQKLVRATLESPLKTAVLEGVLTDTNQEKSAMLRFQHDQQEYFGKIGVAISGNDAKQTYKPLIEYTVPGDMMKTKGNRKPDYSVEGQVVVEKAGDTRKFTFDHVKLVTAGQPEIGIHGFLAKDSANQYSSDIKVTRDKVGLHVKGNLLAELNHIKLDVQVENTINPNANVHVQYEVKKSEHEYDNSLTVTHGADLSSKKHVFSLAQMVKYHYENAQDFDFQTKNKLTYPLVGLNAKLDGKATRKQVKYDFEVGYQKFKLESELDAKLNRKVEGDYDIKFEVEVMNNKVELTAKRDIAGDKSTIANHLDISGKKYSVDGTVTHHVKPNDVNIGTDLTFKLADEAKPFKVHTGLVSNSQNLDSHVKLTIGTEDYVNVVVKASRGPNPHGELKVFLLSFLTADGSFKATDGKGSANIVVSLPRLQRKLKADSIFHLAQPVYDATLNLYFDFEKDNTQKLHIDTKNRIEKHLLQTKNVVEFLKYKTELNAKATRQGERDNGKMSVEFDLLLPNDNFLTGKAVREIHTVNNVANGNGHLTFEFRPSKNGAGFKFDLQSTLKDADITKKVFDVQHNAVIENIDGKNMKIDFHAKSNLVGGRRHSSLLHKFHGSMLPQAFDYAIDGDYTKKEGNYKVAGHYGKSVAALAQGKYDFVGEGKPYTGNVDVHITLPTDKYRDIKFSASGKAQCDNEHDIHEMSGVLAGSLNDKRFKTDGHVKFSKNNGDFKVTVDLPTEDPITVAGKYKHEDAAAPGYGKCHCELEVGYAKDKAVKAGLTVNHPEKGHLDLDLNVVTPSTFAKVIHLQVKNKRTQDGKQINNDLVLDVDQKKYSLSNKMIISEVQPSIELKFTCPDNKNSRIFATFNKVSSTHITGEIRVESVKDFSLDLTGDAQLNSVDDFHITVNAHSDKLHLNKVKLEALNKGAKGGKKVIEFSATSNGKNILSGSTDYSAREEGNKFIVEGSGTFKVKEETKTTNFKYQRQNLVQDKDGEQGIDIMLNAALGSQGLVGELKLSNKQFRILNSYCEEKKQCAHVEVFSKATSNDPNELNHELEVNVDLRKLGFSHEFGLKAVTNRKGLVLDHTVDMHFQSAGDSKYQYSLYIHPKEAGVVFTTPKRVIALEGKLELPSKNKLSPIKGEVALYMNKKAEPAKKTVLSFICDHSVTDHSGTVNSELKFSNPSLNKDLMIKYTSKYDLSLHHTEFTLDIDVFGKKNQKISVVGSGNGQKLDKGYKATAEIKMVSKGLNLEVNAKEHISVQPQDFDYGYELTYHLEKIKSDNQLRLAANNKNFDFLVKLMNKDLIHVNSALQISRDTQIADSQITLLGLKPYFTHTEIKDFNTVKYSMYRDNPANKLQVNTGFVLGQIADFRAEIVRGKEKNDLMHASVKLDESNFLKPDFGVNTDNIKTMLLEPMKKQTHEAIDQAKKVSHDYQKSAAEHLKQLSDSAKKGMPNLKPMAEYYKQELGKLREELVSDKTIQDISETLNKVFGATLQTTNEIFGKLSVIFEKFVNMFQEEYTKMIEFASKEFLPAINDCIGKAFDFGASILHSLYDVAMVYVVRATEFLNAHQNELKQLATTLTQSFREIGRLTMKTYNIVRDEVQKLLKEVCEQAKALPIFEELKASYEMYLQGMPVPEYIVNIVNEVGTTISGFMPTPEMKQFVTKVQDYVTKKFKKEPVNDTEAIKQLYDMFVKAFASLLKFIQNHHGKPEEFHGALENLLPFPIETLYRIPQLASVKFSPLSYLLQGDLPSLRDFTHDLTLNPADMLPPGTFFGQIVQGQHIFTFDGRHLTFPGQCSYLLAKDVANGNFSVATTFGKDGLMESLTFSDKKDTLTMKKGGVATLNGQPTELPARPKGFHAISNPGYFEIIAFSGVHIYCEINLLSCGVIVSGYYHGKTRGLFGNANHEPYDDFTLPNGKVAATEADFGNAYKLGSCAASVKTVDHSAHHHNEACDALFGKNSPMKMCFPFVDPENYHQACEHGLAANIPETEKALSFGYVSACMHAHVPISVPSRFLQCRNGDVPRKVGDIFNVKLPGTAADVVIVVDQDKENEVIYKDLIQPLVTKLTADLAAKGVSDVQFSIIGFGGEYLKHPSSYTNGGKLSFQGKPINLKFVSHEKRAHFHTGCKHLDEFLDKLTQLCDFIKRNLGLTPRSEALRRAYDYPFRANAIKSIVLASTPRKSGSVSLHYISFLAAYARMKDLHLNYIVPLENLAVPAGKDAKQVKNIVGFNEHAVYVTADAKKKGEGNTELAKELHYTGDTGTDIVLRHGGNVFVANNFLQGKQKKQFVEVVSHMMSSQFTKGEYEMKCVCMPVNFFAARNQCYLAHTTNTDVTNAAQDASFMARNLVSDAISFVPS